MQQIGTCPCGCGRPIFLVEKYKGFTIKKLPYGPVDTEEKYWQFKAEKIAKDKLDEAIELAYFDGYGFFLTDKSLECDTAQLHMTEEKAMLLLKESIDKFWALKADIIKEVKV